MLQKNGAENVKSRGEILFLILSAMFWYASHLCSVKTDWVLFFLINIILEKKLKAEKNALKFLRSTLQKHCWQWKNQRWGFIPYSFSYVLMRESSLEHKYWLSSILFNKPSFGKTKGGRRQFCIFFLFFIQSFWNLHTICEIEIRSIFC